MGVKAEEAKEMLSTTVLNHIPTRKYDFRPKVLYLALMIRYRIGYVEYALQS
jgi:hypothetical protein